MHRTHGVTLSRLAVPRTVGALAALDATQGQNDSLFSQLPYNGYL